MYSTQDLKDDHITLRRVKNILERCSDKLYANANIPIEDIEVISVIIEEFADKFHHGKEEKAYFPHTKGNDRFEEDIRKFLIEHELGRRIAIMLRRELNVWKENKNKTIQEVEETTKRAETSDPDKKLLLEKMDLKMKEPTARFLKSYAVFIADHTGKEDEFFDLVQQANILSERKDQMLVRHYELCKNQIGGEVKIEQMMRLVDYLESTWWMKDK